MLHLTFQMVCALAYAAIAGTYYVLIKREIRKRRALEFELSDYKRRFDTAEHIADTWASKYSDAHLDNRRLESKKARLEEEVQRLQGLLMAKQGASDN